MASIFSRIVAGEIPSYKVAEDDRYYAFLDISPMSKGHTLVIPKHEVDYMMDLDEEEYAGLADNAPDREQRRFFALQSRSAGESRRRLRELLDRWLG